MTASTALRALEGEILPPAKTAPSGAFVVVQSAPFQPGAVRTLVLPQGATIADAVAMAAAATKMSPRLQRYLEVQLAGHVIAPRHWARIRPKPGAALSIRVRLKGGDGDDVLRTVLMIAVVIVAAVVAPMITGALGVTGALGTFATAAVQTGLVMAGMMLVNALIPPPQPKSDPWRFDQQPGNPYGALTGFRNQYAPYAPIPRVMGSRRMFPLLAARPYTETQGNDQWLRLLLLVGYGPVNVADIRIGQTPIAAFPGAQIEIREGWDSDAAPTLYTRQIREQSFQIKLDPNQWQERVSEPGTQEISIDISFPTGLISIDPDDGDEDPRTVRFDVQWSANGSDWNNADWIDPRGEWGTGTDGRIVATARSRSTEVRSGRFNVTGNAQGVYRVRMRRTTQYDATYIYDDSYWTVLRSVRQDSPVNMPGLCLIGLRLKASKQLNGVPDVINCLASAYHQVYDSGTQTWSYQLTRNPAWQAADVLRRRGSQSLIAASRLNLDPSDPRSFPAWAQACDSQAPNAQEKRWTADIVLEGGAVISAVQLLAASGRGALAVIDGKYAVVRDIEQSVPAAHISPRNSWGYRGSKAFLDLPHALRVGFINPDKNDAPDEVVVYRDGYNKDGSGGNTAASKFDTLDLPACRSSAMAWREARYHLAGLELRPEEHTVHQDIEQLACVKGSLVRFQHDAISIGIASGRIQALDTDGDDIEALVLDIAVEMQAELTYAVRVRHSDGSSSVHGLVWEEGPSNTLTLSTPAAIAGGPAVGDLVLFGQSSIESAPMIVKRIEPGPDLTARLVMVDAAPGVHEADTGPIPPFESYINRSTPIDENERPARPVLNVRSNESALLRLADGTLIERVELFLDPYTTSTVAAAVWEAEWQADGANGDGWEPVGRGPLDRSIFLSGVAAGNVIHLRARAVSARGNPSDWEYVFDHTVVGKTTPPDAPSGFSASATLNGGQAAWTPSPSVDVEGYELRFGGSAWADATVLGFVRGAAAKQVFHTIALTGGETFRIKAVDAAGLYSSEVTATSTGRTTASGSVIVDWRGLPTNAPGGVALVRSVAAPLSSSSSSSIQVAAHDVYLPGETLSLPSDSITGLSTDTGYVIFWDRQTEDYIAVNSSIETYYTDTTGRYVAVGQQRTQDGGGGFTPPPPPPPGGGGGGGAGGGGPPLNPF